MNLLKKLKSYFNHMPLVLEGNYLPRSFLLSVNANIVDGMVTIEKLLVLLNDGGKGRMGAKGCITFCIQV